VLGYRPPTSTDLLNLPYLECVIKETLRMFPPAVGVFARQAAEQVEIEGWQVPEGSIVRILSYVVHRDPRWFPEPGRFDPERFLPERADQIPAGAYLPFGMGPRACIGNTFAMMEMRLVAAMLLQRFEFSLAEGQREPKLHVGMSLRPAGGMRLLISERPGQLARH
jgi:cytochrome P450